MARTAVHNFPSLGQCFKLWHCWLNKKGIQPVQNLCHLFQTFSSGTSERRKPRHNYYTTVSTTTLLLHYRIYYYTTTTLQCLLLHYHYTTVSTTTQLLHYRVYYYLSFCLTVKWLWLMQQVFTGLMNSFSALSSVLWCCWLSGMKRIWPVKNSVIRYWRGHLSGARCKWFAYGTADATATPSPLAPVKSRMVYLSGAGISRLYWEKGR